MHATLAEGDPDRYTTRHSFGMRAESVTRELFLVKSDKGTNLRKGHQMRSPITYHQKLIFCGKEKQCQKCLAGIGHGPYWYAYETINGRTVQKYIGKHLPDGVDVQTAPTADAAYMRLFTLGQLCLEIRARGGSGAWYPLAETIWEEPSGTLLGALASSLERTLTSEQAGELLGNINVEPAVERLQQLLEPTPRTRRHTLAARLVSVSTEQIRLADQTRIWLDADAFERVLEQALEATDPTVRKQLLEQAMALYGGDFWPRARQAAWCQARRERLHRKWTTLLLELAELHGERGDRASLLSAIDLLNRLLTFDPVNEAAARHLIICLTWLDQRGEALRVYERLAALLEREYAAAPAEETRRLYEDVLRGKKPVSLHSGFVEPHGQIGRVNQNPLAGREQVRERLHALLLEAEQYMPQTRSADQKRSASLIIPPSVRCIFLLGEAGIGKTRLAEEIGREASKRGWNVAWSQAYAQESGLLYRVWAEVLRKVLLQSSWQQEEERTSASLYQPLGALLPELRHTTPEASPPMTNHEQEQLVLWEAARAFLATLSEKAPVLIVLDDLQFADSSSCQLLAYLARRLYDYPVMIVGTCREDELGASQRSLFASLQREGSAESIALEPLSDEQITWLVSQMTSTSSLPESVIQHIRTYAAGNPLFAEELMRTHTIMARSLPASITAVLEHRLDHLTPECRQLLGQAAVLGSSFEFHFLQAMVVSTTIGEKNDSDAVLDRLEEALQAGILSEEGIGTHITYRFWHPLMVGHLYDGLSAGRRASLHRHAAKVLREMYQGREEEGAAAIAYHLEGGGAESLEIAHYAEMAGDRAYRLSAYPEAERYYRLAVEQRGTLPANASREEWTQLANLLERLGESTRIQGKDQEARHSFEQALDARSCVPASPANTQYEVQIDALLWCLVGKTWFATGDYPRAQECYRHGEQVLREAEIQSGPAWANLRVEQGYILWRTGNFAQARISARAALETFGQATEPRRHNQASALLTTATQRTLEGDPVDLGRTHRLLAALALTEGDGQGALTHLNLALDIFEQYDRQREIAHTCDNLGDCYLRSARYEQAQAYLQRGVAIAERIGDTPLQAVGLANLGVLAVRHGNLVEAEARLRQAVELAERIDDPVYQSLWQSFLAGVLQALGKDEEATAALLRALVLCRGMRIASCTGYALVLLSQVRIARVLADSAPTGDTKRRSRSLARAKATLRRALACDGLEAETATEGHIALAEVLWLEGEAEEARQQALEALEEAHRYELLWLAARAQQLLGSICTLFGETEQAKQYFETALAAFHESGMRLEWAHTLQSYGETLLESSGSVERKQGMRYLQQAQHIYDACAAVTDLQRVEGTLRQYTWRES